MPSAVLLAISLAAQVPAAPAPAATPPPPPGPIAVERPETRTKGKLTVASPAFANGAPIPPRHSRNGGNVSPPLAWRGAPARTAAYALIVDDPDGRIKPVTHWTAWNFITTALPEGVLNAPRFVSVATRKKAAANAAQGTTTMRTVGYAGPRPPAGDPPHHYHFQLFALDRPLDLEPGASRDALLAAMAGHVLAKGETIGLFATPPIP